MHLSEETKRKLSEARKGKFCGEKNPHYGKPQSEEARRKISEANKRRPPISEETRHKLSLAGMGKIGPMTGKHHSEATKEKMSISRKANPVKFWLGKHQPPEIIQKRLSHAMLSGEDHPNWQGGISFEPYCPRFTREFKERVRAFFDYRCVECGTPQNGRKLHIHHVTFNKKTCCDSSIPLFVPLCKSCHSKTNFNREYWKQHFTEIINTYYGGKCYLSQEEMTQLTACVGV
jgi:hypothetical protein